MKSCFIPTSWEVVKKWNDPHVLVCGFSKLIEPLEIKRTQAYYIQHAKIGYLLIQF